ncbi:MAG: SDR family oxidoreductase [Bradymonadaceae bacterium]
MYSVPDQSDRVFIVTGANTGIGKVTARRLAEAGGHVFLACRSRERTQPAIDEIREAAGHDNVEFLELDLADFDSIHACADAFLERDLPLHALVNNAGVAGVKGTTEEVFEMHFGVNHLGQYLLTHRLLDRLEASAPSRVVTVASQGNYKADGIDFEAVRQPSQSSTGVDEYNASKLANVLFSAEPGERLEGTGVTTYSLHPGVVASDIWRNVPWPIRPVMKWFMRSEEEGAETTLYCATSPEVADETGFYYEDCQRTDPNSLVDDTELRQKLWNKSAEWTKVSSESAA